MSVSPLLSLRFKIFYAVLSIVILSIHTGLMYLYGFNYKIAFTDAAISTLFLMLAILLLINTLRYYLPKKDRFLYLAAWCVILTISIVFFNKWIITYFLRDETQYIRFFKPVIDRQDQPEFSDDSRCNFVVCDLVHTD